MIVYKSDIEINLKSRIGVEYYAFYLEKSNKGTRFNVDTGIVKVTAIGMTKAVYGEPCVNYKVLEYYKKPKLAGRNIKNILNEFHCQSIWAFYDSYEHACKEYDKQVLQVLKNPKCNANEIKALENILINKKTDLELAKVWYNSLDSLHKNYLKTLGFKL
jgi:hypothetical protein